MASSLRVMEMYPQLFAENSRPEVPVFSEKEGKRFDGIIDRLIVSDSEVIIVDYKNR